jgi:hypothetical protein
MDKRTKIVTSETTAQSSRNYSPVKKVHHSKSHSSMNKLVKRQPSNAGAAEVVTSDSSAQLPKHTSKFLHFIPTSHYSIQLSPSPSLYDLRGKSIEKDCLTVNKLVSYDKAIKKAKDLHNQLKTFMINSAKESIAKKIQLLGKSANKCLHPKCHEFIKEVKAGDVQAVTEMLISAPELIGFMDSTNQTALHWAAKRGDLELVKLLLGFNAKPESSDMVGRTAEDMARAKGHRDIVALLVGIKRISRQNSRKTFIHAFASP